MEKPKPFSLSIRVLLFVGDDANTHNLLQEGRPFIMRFRQVSIHQRRTNGGSETGQSRTANRAKAHGVTSPQRDFV